MENIKFILLAILAFTYGGIYLAWYISPTFVRELITFTVKAWIANRFTWKVKKNGDTPQV